MKKGMYTGVIGLAAIILVVGIAVSMPDTATASDNAALYRNAVLEPKMKWQNSYYVLDKAAEDAILDFVSENGCRYNPGADKDAIKQRIETYFDNALAQMWGGACDRSGDIELNPQSANNFRIRNVTISCSDQTRGIYSEYSKTIEFEKPFTFTNGSSPCDIILTG